MKKLMIAGAAALCATVGFSDVTSANIVGYAKKNCGANIFVQAGAQFESVKDGLLKADEIFSGLPGVDYDYGGDFLATAPQIQVVATDGSGKPTAYFYLNDGYVEADGSTKPGWCDSFGNIVDLTIVAGSGFWLKNTDNVAHDFQGAGQVTAQNSSDITAPAGIFTINANVYPIAINLNNADQVSFPDIVGVDYDYGGDFLGTAPQIQVVATDGSGKPTAYFYLNDGYVEADGSTKPGWCDSFGNIVDVNIAAQSGFWVWAKTGAFKFTYKK